MSLKCITSDACPQPGDSPGGRLFGLQITGAPEVLGEGPHPSPSYNSTELTLAMGGSSLFQRLHQKTMEANKDVV